MPYTPTSWASGTTPADAPELNNSETQYTEATNSFEQDLFTAFVLNGLAATKDGGTANQLDVTAGNAFLAQTDGTLRRRALAASTPGQFTTSTPSTTYYLFLNNTGAWTWGTSSTGPTNSLWICQATTDGSGNISVVTDKRTTLTTFLINMIGVFKIAAALTVAGAVNFLSTLTVVGSSSLDNGAITTNGAGSLTATGTATVGTAAATVISGCVAIDKETTHTVIRPGAGQTDIIIQVNGNNYTFKSDGSVSASGPLVLASGTQETGHNNTQFRANAGDLWVVWVPFKMKMTNVPSSITLSTLASTNITSIGTQDITADGFGLVITANAAGMVTWYGTYTTVGN